MISVVVTSYLEKRLLPTQICLCSSMGVCPALSNSHDLYCQGGICPMLNAVLCVTAPFFLFLNTLQQIIYKSQAFVFNLLKCHSISVTYILINI